MSEQSNPDYLRDEGKFTKSADLNTRYQFVQQNAGTLGRDIVESYSDGNITTRDNLKLMEAIKNNSKLRASYEAIIGITREKIGRLQQDVEPKKERGFFGRLFSKEGNREKTGDVRMSYKDARAQENAIGTSRGTSGGEVIKGLKEYQATIAASKEFEEFNDAFKEVMASAIDGQFIEGGAIGLAKSIFNKLTGRNLQRKLNKLQEKFPNVQGIRDIAANYQRAVLQHSQALDLLMQLNPKNPYANEGILTQLLGYKNKDRVMEVMKKPEATFLESKNRAIVDILISALGSMGGTIDVVLGHVKLPFEKANHPIMDKDIVGRNFLGEGKEGTRTLEAEMRAGDRATGKLADYLKRAVTTTDDINIANEIAATKTQLGERINWSTGRTKDQLAAAKRILFGGRLGVFFGYAFNSDLRAITSDIGKIDDDIPMGEKVAAMDRAIAGLKKEQNLEVAKGKNRTIGDMVRIAEAIDAAEFLQSRMGNYANLDQGKKSVESQNTGVRKLSGILGQYTTYKDFSAQNIVHPDAEQAFRDYYAGKVDATYLYDGPPPAVREFTEVRGNTRKYAEYVGRMNELRAKMEGNTRVEGKRKNNGYWNAENPPQTSSDLENAFRSVDVGGESLVGRYTRQIAQLTGFSTTPDEIYNAAGSASRENIKALNTAFNSVEPGGSQTNDCWILRIPKSMNFNTPNGKVMREGEILIAVKPGCTNLMICDSVFTGSDYQQVRFPGQAVPEHARMILTLSMFRGLEKKGGKKGGKDKPDDCNPDHPHGGGKPTKFETTPQSQNLGPKPAGTAIPDGGLNTGNATLGTQTNLSAGGQTLPPVTAPTPPPPLPPKIGG